MAELCTAITYANAFSPKSGSWVVDKESLQGTLVIVESNHNKVFSLSFYETTINCEKIK
jgi:hypothetical protein